MIKGLENLEIIKGVQTNNYDRRTNDYTSVNEEYEYEISNIERELKALEIIKNKRVDVFELLLGISNSVYRNPLERYNSYVEGSFNTELTPQEFDLLKEVLESE